jgi:hypothetical protein
MLHKIPTKAIYTDFDDNVYFDKTSSRTLFLVHNDDKEVCFFNPNNYDTLQCTPAQFEKMTLKEKLVHCRYVLVYAYIPYEETKTSVFVSAANDQDILYKKLSDKIKIVEKGYHIFNACYLHDTKNGHIVLIQNNLSELQKAIQKYQANKRFPSTTVDTNQAVATAIQHQETNSKNSAKTRHR